MKLKLPKGKAPKIMIMIGISKKAKKGKKTTKAKK